ALTGGTDWHNPWALTGGTDWQHCWAALVGGTGGWAQVGGTGGHRWVALLGTGRWHCRVAQVGALLGTGGGTAGNGWAGLVGALLGRTCGCHCWAPIIRAL
ncbi:unnamed protein product, partial [Staurois parvus]